MKHIKDNKSGEKKQPFFTLDLGAPVPVKQVKKEEFNLSLPDRLQKEFEKSFPMLFTGGK